MGLVSVVLGVVVVLLVHVALSPDMETERDMNAGRRHRSADRWHANRSRTRKLPTRS
jgi:hypothetical protein